MLHYLLTRMCLLSITMIFLQKTDGIWRVNEQIFRIHLNFQVYVRVLSPFVWSFFRKQLMCFVYLIDSILRMVRLRSSHFTFGFRTIRHSFVVFSKYFFHCHRSPSDICAIDKVITKIPIHASYRTEIVEREKEMMLWGNTALWTLLNKNNSKWITKEW